MKEANNINTSLLTLGRCISAMRHNQMYRCVYALDNVHETLMFLGKWVTVLVCN